MPFSSWEGWRLPDTKSLVRRTLSFGASANVCPAKNHEAAVCGSGSLADVDMEYDAVLTLKPKPFLASIRAFLRMK